LSLTHGRLCPALNPATSSIYQQSLHTKVVAFRDAASSSPIRRHSTFILGLIKTAQQKLGLFQTPQWNFSFMLLVENKRKGQGFNFLFNLNILLQTILKLVSGIG